MANCILPSSWSGGTAYDINFAAGFGGSPGKSMVKFVNESGSYGTPTFNLNSSFDVGTTGRTRPQTPVSYSVDLTPGGSSLTVEFEDHAILALQRTAVALAPLPQDGVAAIPSTGCVKVLGKLYHKIPGSPDGISTSTVAFGGSPTITEGDREKKIAREMMLYTGAELANALGTLGNGFGGMLGSSLYSQLSGIGDYLTRDGDALGIIQDLAGRYGFSLFANSSGALDCIDVTGGVNLSSALAGIGDQCNLVSYNAGSNIRGTHAQGAIVQYNHDDEWLQAKTQNFKNLDMLGMAIPSCHDDDGEEKVSLYKEDMTAEEILHLKRLLKISILDQKWQNWDGGTAWLHLKRLPLANEKDPGMNILRMGKKKAANGKDVIEDCQITGRVPVRKSKNIQNNKSVDKLMPCLKPGILGEASKVDKNGVAEPSPDLDADIEKGFTALNAAQANPRLGPTEIIVLGDLKTIDCDGVKEQPKDPLSGKIYNPVDVPEAKWAQGGAADRLEMLSQLAQSVGRFWIMTGGGGGAGAGLMTKRADNDRDYDVDEGSLIWYDARASVKTTVFDSLYRKFMGSRLEKWKNAGGITNAELGITVDAAGDPVDPDGLNDVGDDLSVSQFLQLVAKCKSLAQNGNEDKIDEEEAQAHLAGDGMSSEDLAEEAKANLEKCANEEPKGIVIWDKGEQDAKLPLKDSVLAKLSAGIEAYSDKGGNDVMKWLAKQAKLGIIVNPMKEGAGGDPDEVDAELDDLVVNDAFDMIGERRVESIPYDLKKGREYHYAYHEFPDCGTSAYKFTVESGDTSGQVLWRDVDCRGQDEPWRKDFNQSLAVQTATQTVAADLAFTKDDPENFFTVSTCGGGAANIPSVSEGMTAYNVELQEDGSVNTTYTVSSRERMEADSKVHKFSYASAQGTVASSSKPDLTNPFGYL
jgi:hypothetical protein